MSAPIIIYILMHINIKATISVFSVVTIHMNILVLMQNVGVSVCLTSMLRKLGVGQNLLAELQPISVLLVLIASLQNQETENKSQLPEFVDVNDFNICFLACHGLRFVRYFSTAVNFILNLGNYSAEILVRVGRSVTPSEQSQVWFAAILTNCECEVKK